MKTLNNFVDLLAQRRVITLAKDIDCEFTKYFRDQVQEVICNDTPKKSDIAIVVETCGGDVDRGFQVNREIQALNKRYRVWTISATTLRSAGVIIALSVPYEQRVGFSTAEIYCHLCTATSVIETGQHYLNSAKYRSHEELANINSAEYWEKEYKKLVRKEIGPGHCKELFDNPRYVRAKEALKLGFISKILT